MKRNDNPRLERMALTVAETRSELGVSQRELALLTGVSTSTIRKLERGRRIHPALLLRLGTALTVLELHGPPAPEPELAEVLAIPPALARREGRLWTSAI